MEIGEKFLPLGTVVRLKNATKRVMITGFCAIANGDSEKKVWDYSGCLYPEGFIDSLKTCLFNHDQIEEISHLGLADDEEEKAFKSKLNSFTKTL